MSRPAHTADGAETNAAPRRWTVTVDGQRLRRLRRQHGLSQETLAEVSGISLATVGRLDLPCAPCRGRTLGRLAWALGEHPAATTLRPSGG